MLDTGFALAQRSNPQRLMRRHDAHANALALKEPYLSLFTWGKHRLYPIPKSLVSVFAH